jgi:hypothetical protein
MQAVIVLFLLNTIDRLVEYWKIFNSVYFITIDELLVTHDRKWVYEDAALNESTKITHSVGMPSAFSAVSFYLNVIFCKTTFNVLQ